MQEIYTLTMLLSIASFTLASVLTPGPNNIMLLSSGLTFGYKQTIPHMIGISLGYPIMIIGVGMGVGAIFDMYPVTITLLKIVGISYLFWMAWHIANAKGQIKTNTKNKIKPFSFIQAASFQWLNPKGWIVAITSTVSFTTNSKYAFYQVLVIALIFFFSSIIACNFWTLGGVYLKKLVKNELHVQIFNITMALLIVASVLPFIFD